MSRKQRGKLAAARQAHFAHARRGKRSAVPMRRDASKRGLTTAHAAYQIARDAAETRADVAFHWYQAAFRLYDELYQEDPHGPHSDTCLRQIRVIGWELWRVDRRRFSIGPTIDLTRELIRRHPRSAREWANLSDFLLNAGQWEKALTAALVACQCEPSDANSWSTLARCYFALGRIGEGEEACETAVELRSSAADYRPDAAGLSDLLLLGRYGEGCRAWAQANAARMDGTPPERVPITRRQLLGRPRWRGERTDRTEGHYAEGRGHGRPLSLDGCLTGND